MPSAETLTFEINLVDASGPIKANDISVTYTSTSGESWTHRASRSGPLAMRFTFGKAVAALCILLLRHAASSKQRTGGPSLIGRKGSAASSLDYAITQRKSALAQLIPGTLRHDACFLRWLQRDNTEGKDESRPTTITVKSCRRDWLTARFRRLVPDAGYLPIEDAIDLRDLAGRMEKQCFSSGQAEMKLLDFSEGDLQDQARFGMLMTNAAAQRVNGEYSSAAATNLAIARLAVRLGNYEFALRHRLYALSNLRTAGDPRLVEELCCLCGDVVDQYLPFLIARPKVEMLRQLELAALDYGCLNLAAEMALTLVHHEAHLFRYASQSDGARDHQHMQFLRRNGQAIGITVNPVEGIAIIEAALRAAEKQRDNIEIAACKVAKMSVLARAGRLIEALDVFQDDPGLLDKGNYANNISSRSLTGRLMLTTGNRSGDAKHMLHEAQMMLRTRSLIPIGICIPGIESAFYPALPNGPCIPDIAPRDPALIPISTIKRYFGMILTHHQ